MAKRKAARNKRASDKFKNKHPEGRKRFARKKKIAWLEKHQPNNQHNLNQLEKLNNK